MKYIYVPKPSINEDEETRPLHKLENGVFTVGWEVGRTIPTEDGNEWEKLYEVMELTEEQKAEVSEEKASALQTFFEDLANPETNSISKIRASAQRFIENTKENKNEL